MTLRLLDGFFYGLFMDAAVLESAGTKPSNFRRAYVDGFELRIGDRATLVPAPGARAYGMVIALSQEDLDRLYGAPGLEDYRPEAVLARVENDQAVAALCYNLPEPPGAHERNPAYAERLGKVLQALGFPNEYVASVTRTAPASGIQVDESN